MFIAANWPADLTLRAADSNLPLGPEGASVWESWVIQENVFLNDGNEPTS